MGHRRQAGAGLPIHRLIGTCRDKIGAYASSEIHTSREAYVEQAMHYQSTGWHAYKIHPPQQWREDIKVCEAVRKAVGDDYQIMLDSTWSYRYEEALRVGLAIQELGYYWYEDPLHEQDIYNYVKLRQKLTSRSWLPSIRSAASIHTFRGSPSGPPTSCAATSP